MKALNFTQIVAVFMLLLIASFAKAQTPVHCCTVVEVTDGYFTDKVWMITEPGTTDGFDNGWDGYKFLNTTAGIPQICDRTIDGDFQVSSFPTIENNGFVFIPGVSTEYTLKFIHYDITYFYKGLYLVDMLTHDTVNVYTNLSTYKFKSTKADLVERFKFITKVPEKPVVVTPGDNIGKNKNVIIDKKVKVFSSRRMLKIENPYKVDVNVNVIEASSGKLLGSYVVSSKSTISIGNVVTNGPVIVQTSTETGTSSTTVLVK